MIPILPVSFSATQTYNSSDVILYILSNWFKLFDSLLYQLNSFVTGDKDLDYNWVNVLNKGPWLLFVISSVNFPLPIYIIFDTACIDFILANSFLSFV